jgi:hypothetical protein
MLRIVVFAAVAVLFRVIPHAWNAVPVGALALFAGSRLPRKWAWIVPLAAMGVSDLFLDLGTGREFWALDRWTIYGTFALITLMGPLANRPKIGPFLLPGLSLAASVLFFITSNLATWAWYDETLYPHTLNGLWACYVAAIPFFDKTILADLVGTAVLFGTSSLLDRVGQIVVTRRPSWAGVTESADVASVG